MILNMIDDEQDDREVIRRLRGVSKSGLMEQTNENETILHAAVDSGDARSVRVLLDANVIDVDTVCGPKKRSALFDAIQNNDTDIIKILLEHSADNNIKPPDGVTPLLWALQCADTATIKLVLKFGTDREIEDPQTGMTPMLYATARRDIDIIEALVRAGALMSEENSKGLTALIYACKKRDIPMVKYLLKRGHRLRIGKRPEISAMHAAIRNNDREIFDILLEAGFDLEQYRATTITSPAEEALLLNNTILFRAIMKRVGRHLGPTTRGSGLIHMAAQMGNLEALKILLDPGEGGYMEDINTLNNRGESVLLDAISTNRTDIVDFLIGRGVITHQIGEQGMDPIIYAQVNSSTEMVLHMMRKGFPIDGVLDDKISMTFLGLAVMNNSTEVVAEALRRGVWPDEPFEVGGNAVLVHAVREGSTKIVELLLEYGANPRRREVWRGGSSMDMAVSEKEIKELCPIHHAAMAGHLECLKLLIHFGATITEWGPEGKDALFYAIEGNHTETAIYLANQGANVRRTDLEGLTPTLVAARIGNAKIIRALLEKGAIVDAAPIRGVTPLYIATMLKHREAMEVLIEYGASLDFSDTYGYTPAALAASKGDVESLKIIIRNGGSLDVSYLREPFKEYHDNDDDNTILLPSNKQEGEQNQGGDVKQQNPNTALSKKKLKPYLRSSATSCNRGIGFTISSSEEEEGLTDADDDFFETGSEENEYYYRENNSDDSMRKQQHLTSNQRTTKKKVIALKATPLIDAIWRNMEALVEFMLKSGASSPNFMPKGEQDITPLHVAVRQNSPKLCEILLKYGADKNYKGPNPKSLSVMSLAIRLDRMECVSVLLKAGASITQDIGVRKQGTLLSLIKARREEAVKLFLQLGVDPNEPAKNYAAAMANATKSQQLCDLNKKNNHHLDKENLLLTDSSSTAAAATELATPALVLATETLLNATVIDQEEASMAIMRALLDAGADPNARRMRDNITSLLLAVRHSHQAAVRMLIERGADVHLQRHDGSTALHVACLESSYGIVMQILGKGPSIDARMTSGLTPLFVACQGGRSNIIEELLERGADPNARVPSSGATPIIMAIQSLNLDSVKMLVEYGAEIKGNDETDETVPPLIMAVQLENLPIVEYLVEHGADPNVMVAGGVSPLHVAVHKNNSEMVRLLIQKGADPGYYQDGSGSVLMHCAARGNAEVAEVLLSAGANPNAYQGAEDRPLFIAAEQGFAKLVSHLIRYKADVNWRHPVDQTTSLHLAVESGHVDVVNMLLEAGADASAANIHGVTPLLIACVRNSSEIALSVIRAGAELDTIARNGATPLLAATQSDNEVIVNALLQAGADVEFMNSDGYTPLLVAVRHNSTRSLPAILRAGPNLRKAALDNISPAKLAVMCNHSNVLKSLLEKGVDPDECTGTGSICLLNAAVCGSSVDTINVLLQSQADVNFQDGDGVTPLISAVRANRSSVAKTLLAAGANPNITDKDGFGPLHYYFLLKNTEMIRIFMQHNSTDINLVSRGTAKRDTNQVTALFVAVNEGHEIQATHLLEFGANPNIPNEESLTPLGNAAWQGNLRMCDLLLRFHANIDALNTNGATALFLAIQQEKWSVMQLLIEKGAKSDIPDYSGWTPLMWASARGNTMVVQYLLEKGRTNPNQKTILGCTAAHCAAYHKFPGFKELCKC